MAQLEKIREFISVLVQTQRARMIQGVAQQNPAMSTASSVGNVAAPLQNPNVSTAGPSRQSFQSGNASNAHDGAQNTLGSNMGTNISNAFNPQLNGSRPPQNPVQPQNQFLWRGSLSITGQDGRRAGELLVFLNVMKANPQQLVCCLGRRPVLTLPSSLKARCSLCLAWQDIDDTDKTTFSPR
jgi:hypothetical protein